MQGVCMSMLSWKPSSAFEPISWQAEARARLEERHLIAWSRDAATRARFAGVMGSYLAAQPSTRVCELDGSAMRSVDGVFEQFKRLVPVRSLSRTIDGPSGLASLLREPSGTARSRVFLWRDADALLARDRSLFGAMCEVLSGVSAEIEMGDEPGGFDQRVVYVGSEALAEEARRVDSVMTSWAPEGGTIPFWALVSGLCRPPLALCSIDRLVDA